MREQTRGFAGDRRDGRAVPSAGRARVPDHAADAHRRGAGRDGQGGRRSRRCEFITVESEFAAMSAAIGASAAGARTLHRHREPGPALHGRGAVQRRRTRPADRDDGRQPRDRRADQHLERPQRLDEPARLRLDPALRRGQPGGGRPARRWPSRLAEQLSRAGDGLRGRLRAHPRLRADRACPAGDASTRFLPALPTRARCSTPTSRSRSARWSGPRRSPRCATWPTTSCAAPSDVFADVARAVTAVRTGRRSAVDHAYRLPTAPRTVVVALGSVLGTIQDASTSWRRRRRSASLGAHACTGRSPRPRSGPRCATPSHVIVLERAFAPGAGGIVTADVRGGAGRDAGPRSARSSPGSAAGRSPRPSLRAMLATRRARRRSPSLSFLDLDARRRRARAGPAAGRSAPGRPPRTWCARSCRPDRPSAR